MDNPAELEKIRDRESDITKERIQKILDAGANVVLTTKGIDDMSLKYFVEAGVIACRRVPKEDLRWVSKKRNLSTHCIRAEKLQRMMSSEPCVPPSSLTCTACQKMWLIVEC